MKPCHLTVLRTVAGYIGRGSTERRILEAVDAAIEEIHIAQMRGDELARELDAAQTCISELQRELAAARTYIRELERENAGSFW